jgi:hypothetical protein
MAEPMTTAISARPIAITLNAFRPFSQTSVLCISFLLLLSIVLRERRSYLAFYDMKLGDAGAADTVSSG